MKFAFFFPGQGSQSVGMMQGLADIAVVRQTFNEASEILGQDFWTMVTEPNEALNQTANTQPAYSRRCHMACLARKIIIVTINYGGA